MRFKFLACVAVIAGVWAGLAAFSNRTGESGEVSRSREAVIFPSETVSVGWSYEQVRQAWPAVSAERPEGGYPGGRLTEAFAEAEVLGHGAEIEFNLEDGKLYSAYCTIAELDEGSAAEVAEYVLGAYKERFGAGRQEADAHGAYKSTTVFWEGGECDYALTLSATAGTYRVSWGMQKAMEAGQ